MTRRYAQLVQPLDEVIGNGDRLSCSWDVVGDLHCSQLMFEPVDLRLQCCDGLSLYLAHVCAVGFVKRVIACSASGSGDRSLDVSEERTSRVKMPILLY